MADDLESIAVARSLKAAGQRTSWRNLHDASAALSAAH